MGKFDDKSNILYNIFSSKIFMYIFHKAYKDFIELSKNEREPGSGLESSH